MQPGELGTNHYPYNHQHQHHPQPPPPNPNPNDLQPPTYASAPPFSSHYSSSTPDYSNYYSYSSSVYPQNPDPVVPNLPPPEQTYTPNPNYQTFNPSPPQPNPISPFPTAPESNSHFPSSTPPYYPPYDPHQVNPNYGSQAIPSTNSNPNPISNFNHSSTPPLSSSHSYGPYDMPYDNSVKYGQRGGYGEDNPAVYGNLGVYGRSQSDVGPDLYDKRPGNDIRYDHSAIHDDGVYAYDGGKADLYGARGTSAKSSTWSTPKPSTTFDDYGRSMSGIGKDQGVSAKVVRATPKVEAQQDVKSGVQKFRVKILPEGGGSSMDVLCQIGLDGIRMLDPNNSRTLRIYPLETITRSEVIDSSIFAFWSKSSVDVEPRRIRLQSNSYTTNTLLDTVTAATIQLKEMGGKDSFRSNSSDSGKLAVQTNEKKKGLGDWMNMIKPGNEEKDHWVPDEAVTKCTACATDFNAFVRKHHCRNCGDIFCDKCTHGRITLTSEENAQPVRVCDRCMAEVTQRLSNAKESVSRPSGFSHEEYAKKLQEEMDRNHKSSSGSKTSSESGRRMREVACPTCTVHLQVQVPSSGSETIECGVCQHAFLVSSH